MEDKLVGLLPFPASTIIDYKSQRISFRYIDSERYNTKLKIFWRLYLAWLNEFGLIVGVGLVIWAIIKGALDLCEYITTNSEPNMIFTQLIIVAIAIPIIPLVLAILHLFTPLGERMKKIIPWMSEIRHWEKRWIEIKKAQGNKVIVPLFNSLFMDWEAEGEFKDLLEKVEVKEQEFNVGYKGKKEYNLYAVFHYSKKPESGSIIVRWWA